MVRKTKQTLHRYMHITGKGRWLRMIVALVILFSLFIPGLTWINDLKAYALTPETEKVIGSANTNLSAKFSYDSQNELWQFNSKGSASQAEKIAKQQGTSNPQDVAAALSQLQRQQTGGGGKEDESLYSVDLSVKADKGIVYYDNQTKLSFKMLPQFTSRDAKKVQDRIVYPFNNGGQIIYTAKSNGLKEDIVLSHYIGDTLRFGYSLDLPKTLEARLLEDGSIGIYSADPALFSNISYGSNADQAKVASARETAPKNNLVFGIPAPIIKDQTGQVAHTKYQLTKNQLTVFATGLKGLSYPLSVDPSVTITSSADFLTGNNEGMIDFGPAGQINRGGVTGGTLGSSWASADTGTPMGGTGRFRHSSVTYNGYLYVLGGSITGPSETASVNYVKINSDGTLGTWQSGGNFLGQTRYSFAAAAYNGYLYVLGGTQSSNTTTNDVQLAPLNSSTGAVGTWQYTYNSTSSPTVPGGMPTARWGHTVSIYNSNIYVIGGCSGQLGGCRDSDRITTNVAIYAPLNANGTVGAWTALANAPSAVFLHTSEVYNNHIYIMGGCTALAVLSTDCNTISSSVSYATINTDGTLGSWASTSSFTTARWFASSSTSNGYMYIFGGCTLGGKCGAGSGYVNDVQYARINANGTLGTWSTTTSFTTPRFGQSSFIYNSNAYVLGGCSATSSTACTTFQADTLSAKIDSAGAIRPFSTEADFDTNSREYAAVAAGNGYIYILGGTQGGIGNGTNTGLYAAINSDGSIGTWNAITAFADVRLGATAVIYGNSLYLVGGATNPANGTGNCVFNDSASYRMCTKVERATINPTTGQLTWVDSFTYYVDNPRFKLTAVVNEGYFYVIGGIYSSNSNESTEVDYAQINSDDTLGTFTKTTAQLSTARGEGVGAVAWNGNIYVVGGRNHATAEVATPNPATGDISTWSAAGNALPLVGGQTTRSMSVSGSGGYVYVSGGQSTSLTLTNAIQIAKINPDGTLGNWVTSQQTMTNNHYAHGSAAYNGYLYVAGGCITNLCSGGGNVSKSYQYAKINNGGNGAVGTWANKGSFTNARSQAASATYNGYVYLMGGCTTATGIAGCTTSTNDTRYAQVAVDGSLTWAALNSNMPTNRFGHASVAYNGYLYAVGGCSSTGGTNGFCTSFLNDVQRIKLNADGNTVGNSWGSAGTTLGTARYGLSAAVYNGYMYVTGGCSATTSGDCSTAQQTVEYAQINPDGSLGGWNTTGGSGFTTGRFLHGTVAYAGNLYVAAGCSAMGSGVCTTMQNDIQFAAINSNGTVSSTWNLAGYFPTPRYGASLTAQNGIMYLSGGCSAHGIGICSTYQPDILKAALSPSGNLGSWEKVLGTAYTDPRYLHTSIISNGNLYLLGGMKTGSALLADSMGSALEIQSRIGKYSTLVLVSSAVEIAGVYYNGTLGMGSTLQYKVAPSTGLYGSAQTGTQGTGSEPTPLCGQGNIYYVWIALTMDDTYNATFTHSDTTSSNVTDITVYYRLNASPAPNQRLFGGKWFYSEIQQPLDTCKQ